MKKFKMAGPNLKIGFMQGRLSPLINRKIQSFPWQTWKKEFEEGNKINLTTMEWTIDQERIYENPLMTTEGQNQVKDLCTEYNFSIPSLTGDCFMQAPLWKSKNNERKSLEKVFLDVANSCSAVNIEMIVMPLVDNGSLENINQENDLIAFLKSNENIFLEKKLKILFESDYAPIRLAKFIDRLNPLIFGINYDIGNSAALGFDCKDEFIFYAHRILNVHVKDRLLGGTTVPLGTGAADFEKVFQTLANINYEGNYILQTARARDNQHSSILSFYRDMTVDWINKYAH
jgi:L-ribulose-5-phosphate 3-epimerase